MDDKPLLLLPTRYLVFSGFDYYPTGGAHDFLGAFDRLDNAMAVMERATKDGRWAHVVSFDGEALDMIAPEQAVRWWSIRDTESDAAGQ